MTEQIYEDYWNFTLAWTNFNGDKFLTTLQTIVDYIDTKKPLEYSKKFYLELQDELKRKLKLKTLESVRKGINQCVKLGFVNSSLTSYHESTKLYLKTKDEEERKSLLSKIVYSCSSFQRSVTKPSKVREINFVMLSIFHMDELPASLLPAMICININDYKEKGYITKEELELESQKIDTQSFVGRKYNQISYLKNLLKKLDKIVYNESTKTFSIKQEIEPKEASAKKGRKGRDKRLQGNFKHSLEQESMKLLGGKPKCMVKNLPCVYHRASHIKPLHLCNETEEYDSDNGLLLSLEVDGWFDKYHVSFDNEGKIIFYDSVNSELKEELKGYKINPVFMNEKRKKYLEFHRGLCEAKQLKKRKK